MAKTSPDSVKKAKAASKSRSEAQTDPSLNKRGSSRSKEAAPQEPDAELSDREGSVRSNQATEQDPVQTPIPIAMTDEQLLAQAQQELNAERVHQCEAARRRLIAVMLLNKSSPAQIEARQLDLKQVEAQLERTETASKLMETVIRDMRNTTRIP
ncbi:hypothetical protein BGZ97_010656, partial [Linnemannia gamsii]